MFAVTGENEEEMEDKEVAAAAQVEDADADEVEEQGDTSTVVHNTLLQAALTVLLSVSWISAVSATILLIMSKDFLL